MKARRKSDGEIIEVEAAVYNMKTGEPCHKCLSDGHHYPASDLDFKLDADTVIQGWVCRDDNCLNAQVLIGDKPKRTGYNYWENKSADCITLPKDSFPDLKWESDPIEVELIIKRKKK